MARLLAGLAAWWAAGCGGPPGEREFQAGVQEYARGNWVRARALMEKAMDRRPGSADNAVAANYAGCAAWQLKQLPDAVKAFETSRRLNPAYAAPLYNLAMLQYAGGNTAQAIALLTEAAARAPDRPEALEALGQIYLAHHAWPEAERVLADAARRAPDAARIQTARAVVAARTGGQRQAIAGLNRVLDRHARYAPALFDLGVIYLQHMNDRVQGAACLRKFLEAGPADIAAADYARQLLGDLGVAAPPPHVVPAATSLSTTVSALLHAVTRTAATVRPVAVVTAAPPRTVEMDWREAAAAAEQGHAAQALNLYLEAAARAGREQNPALQEKSLVLAVRNCAGLARAPLALGRFQLEHGRADVALKSFKQALKLDPKLVPALLGLAAAATQTGEPDAVVDSLKTAVQLEPQNAEALWELARFYDRSPDFKEYAAQRYRQFVRMFPGDPRVVKAQERVAALEPAPARGHARPPDTAIAVARPPETAGVLPAVKNGGLRNPAAAAQAYNRARLYQTRQEWDSAIAFYQRAIENDPALVNAYFNLGVVYSAKGEPAAAREAYERAIRVQPDLVAARYNLALVYRELKERNAALAQLRAILALQAGYAPAYYVLGYILSEDPAAVAQAKQAYQRFLELAPADPAAANVRDWLRRH